jgi:hypothetical protein
LVRGVEALDCANRARHMVLGGDPVVFGVLLIGN